MAMRTIPADPGAQLVNRLLDHIRAQRAITSDEALAQALGVSDMAIYRWRRGQLDKSARVLLPLAITHAEMLQETP